MTTATPTKLRNGNWGAKVKGTVREGDSIQITTRAGKSWVASVSKVIWSGQGVSIVATGSAGSGSRKNNRGRECDCGACEDLISHGYRPGARITCSNCGGWAEAY